MANLRSRVSLAVMGVLAAAANVATQSALAQEKPGNSAPVDEVTVTGTFIRQSEGFTPASPVAEISRADFEANAPKTVADFLTTLPYSFNSTFTVGRALGSSNGSGSINLRNLGADATLVLLNSRRVARDPVTVNNVDVNALLPQIAIERVEILKDGASSLYGSDAVGGVANFLTRRHFDGFEFTAQSDTREIGSTTDFRVSGLWGLQTDKTNLIVAAEYFDRAPYNWESFEVISSRKGTIDAEFRSNNGWPGRYAVPNRGPTGALLTGTAGSTTVADPLCSLFTGENTAIGSAARPADPTAYPANCAQNLAFGTSGNADEKRVQAFAELHHEFADGFKIFSEVGFLRNRTELIDAPGAGINPGIGQPSVVVPGYAPGNLFRAVSSTGTPLFAQSSGVQLNYDKNGDGINEFIPARDSAGNVIVVSSGGVPFWEDVTVVAGSRNLGLNCNLPGDPATTHNCRNDLNPTRYEIDALRGVVGAEGELGGDWHYTASYTISHNKEDQTSLGASFSMPNLRAALAGFGGDGCVTTSTNPLLSGTVRPGQGSCSFFNIFGNSVTAPAGSRLINSPDMVLYITAQDWAHYSAKTGVIDAIVSGPILKLPAGPLGVAVGLQQRRENWTADYPTLQNQGNSDLQAAFFDKDVKQTAAAVYAEVNVPIIDNAAGALDFSGAVRYEDTYGPDLDTTDPKLGLLYSTPNDMVKLRGTWSTSFLAPSLYQRFRQNAAFTNNVVDGRNPSAPAQGRVTTLIRGNSALKPQTSKNYNLGITVVPVSNLNIDVDYWHFKFDDAITLENGTVIARDPVSTEDPTKVVRNASGTITGLNLTYVNNAALETAGIDAAITYKLDMGSFGSLRNTAQSTYQSTYKVNGIDRKGSRNATVAGASFSIPWRATLRTDWQLGSHALQSLLRYTDGYANDAAANQGSTPKPYVESFISWDLSYSYSFEWERFNLKNSSASIGLNNVLDTVPPWVPDVNHTLFTIYDYSGRHIWLRLKAQF